MSIRRIAARAIMPGALTLSGVVVAFGPQADATAVPPEASTFIMSSLAVSPGSQVALHWRGSAEDGQFFIVASAPPTALPNFGSNVGVTWPPASGASWDESAGGWISTSHEVTASVPTTASPGTIYKVQLYTCSTGSRLCSNSPGGDGDSQVALTVVANWSSTPYERDFSSATGIAETTGRPLDVIVSPTGVIWNSSEFSDGIGEIPKAGSSSVWLPDPSNVDTRPFADCFSGACRTNASSALSEQVTTDNGQVWFTEGGWLFDSDDKTPNLSEVVAYNPNSGTFCTYVVPGNNNEVTGLAVTGSSSQTRIWFTETDVIGDQPSVDSFAPGLIGDGCPGTKSETYSLNAHLQEIPWPANDFPAQIAVDPSAAALWVTDFLGSEVDRVDLKTDRVARYLLPKSSNTYSFFGAEPWQVVVDDNYVYAIDYGDDNLVRINKETGHIDEVPIPVTSDREEGYGLAIAGGRLYFTLADDGPPGNGAASTLGYVDIGAWEAESASCSPHGTDCAPDPPSAVVYTGLSAALSDRTSDFRGISVGPGGTVAIADRHQVIRLDP